MTYKYIVIVNLEGKHYKDKLPLHLTLMPWFESREEQIATFLDTLSRQIKPFKVHLDKEAMFGANSDIKVNLIKQNEKLITIHKQILKFIRNNDYSLINDNYIDSKYNPHATKVK